LFPVRSFTTKKGEAGKVANLILADDTSNIKVVLWDMNHISLIEKEEIRRSVENDFYWLLEDFKGIAGGRITANLGVEGREGTTLMNCFVFNPGDVGYQDPDSINGIYDMLKAQALTLKSEGGYGMNFSWIRPAGMYVRGIDSRTPGVIQMMSLWNQSSAVITMGSDKILGVKCNFICGNYCNN
jgi:ribonucleotide reductase alpha subunit